MFQCFYISEFSDSFKRTTCGVESQSLMRSVQGGRRVLMSFTGGAKSGSGPSQVRRKGLLSILQSVAGLINALDYLMCTVSSWIPFVYVLECRVIVCASSQVKVVK